MFLQTCYILGVDVHIFRQANVSVFGRCGECMFWEVWVDVYLGRQMYILRVDVYLGRRRWGTYHGSILVDLSL